MQSCSNTIKVQQFKKTVYPLHLSLGKKKTNSFPPKKLQDSQSRMKTSFDISKLLVEPSSRPWPIFRRDEEGLQLKSANTKQRPVDACFYQFMLKMTNTISGLNKVYSFQLKKKREDKPAELMGH